MASSKSLIAAGFGGQGLLMLGRIVAYAGMKEGYHVTWMPSYGPEMRGGTANCTVIISDQEIGAPIVERPDYAVVLNKPSFIKYEPKVLAGGVLVVNSDMVDVKSSRSDIRVVEVPCSSIAIELGNSRVLNMVALGALVESSGLVKVESCVKAIEETFSEKAPIVELNLRAFERGREAARRAL